MTVGIDFSLSRTDLGLFDIRIAPDGDIQTTEGLETAIYVSLFTDRRASESEVLRAQDRRGFWGNELNDIPNFEIGSKLWLLDQARNTQNTLNRAVDYARQALRWLIDDNIVKSIEVTGTRTVENIVLKVVYIRDASITESANFTLWENTDFSKAP